MKILVQGLATEYADEGTGPVVLMLHGWKDTLYTFDAITRQLADQYRIVRLDMPGFGATEIPDPSWRLDDYVDFVEDFIEKLNLHVDTLVGHSFGGRVIIKGVSRNVFAPRRVVLIAAAGVAERKAGRGTALKIVAKIGKFATSPLPRGVRQKLRHRLYKTVGSDYHASGRLKDIFLNVVQENLALDASAITIPTLLVWGAEDSQTPLSEGEKLRHLIRGSQLETIRGASHFVHQEHPEKVASLIRSFL